MPTSRPKGIVFVSYTHADRARVEPLVDQLKTRFNVFWDAKLQPGDVWRQVLADRLQQARCVVALWTKNLTDASFVTSEVELAQRRGVLVPVKLDMDAHVPLGFDRWHYVDLGGWSGKSAAGLAQLFTLIRRLLAQPAPRPWANALPEAAGWAVPGSTRAVAEMRGLVREVKTLGGVLMRNDGPMGEVAATLDEIHATYAAASEAIDRFLAPAGARRGALKTYAGLAGGSLSRLVDDKRGHCSRILEHYGRAGGLREWLAERTQSSVLADADAAFGRLATADGDLFAELSRIGDVLSDEASDIASLLRSEQTRPAAVRIAAAQRTLMPLRRQLGSAMSQLQRVEASMGFVPGRSR